MPRAHKTVSLSARLGALLFVISVCSPLTLSASRAVLILGDSISAGYGLSEQSGWVWMLQQHLGKQQPRRYRAINASINGETTDGALERLPELMETHRPGIVIVELGGNDGLRGYPTGRLQANLIGILSAVVGAGATAVLVEVPLPPNYGKRYRAAFGEAFAVAGRHCGCPHVKLLDGIEYKNSTLLADGIHPSAEVQPQIFRNVWRALEPLL